MTSLEIKNPVDIVPTGLSSGVGGNDQKLNFVLSIEPSRGAFIIGPRIGPVLTKFNIIDYNSFQIISFQCKFL